MRPDFRASPAIRVVFRRSGQLPKSRVRRTAQGIATGRLLHFLALAPSAAQIRRRLTGGRTPRRSPLQAAHPIADDNYQGHRRRFEELLRLIFSFPVPFRKQRSRSGSSTGRIPRTTFSTSYSQLSRRSDGQVQGRQGPAEIYRRSLLDPQSFQPGTSSLQPGELQTPSLRRLGRVASTCSLRALDCWFYWSDQVSLTMPTRGVGRVPQRGVGVFRASGAVGNRLGAAAVTSLPGRLAVGSCQVTPSRPGWPGRTPGAKSSEGSPRAPNSRELPRVLWAADEGQ